MMNNTWPDVRIVFSFACLISALAYGYVGSLLFLIFTCLSALLAVYCFASSRFRYLVQRVVKLLHFHMMAAVTWILLGIVYMTVFIAFHCFIVLCGKRLSKKPIGNTSSWISVSAHIGREDFERQF